MRLAFTHSSMFIPAFHQGYFVVDRVNKPFGLDYFGIGPKGKNLGDKLDIRRNGKFEPDGSVYFMGYFLVRAPAPRRLSKLVPGEKGVTKELIEGMVQNDGQRHCKGKIEWRLKAYITKFQTCHRKRKGRLGILWHFSGRTPASKETEQLQKLTDEAFISIWKDRKEMKDSDKWLHTVRRTEWGEPSA